jgi:hypothetical protein
MGEMPWGTHVCVFYDTKEDLLDTCAAYFEAGLQSNEFCIWGGVAPSQRTESQGLAAPLRARF